MRLTPTWDGTTVTVAEAATPNNTFSSALPVLGKYVIISNLGPINIHVGSDASGATIRGILVEPGASLEFAVGKDAEIYIWAAANTGKYTQVWFT